MKTAVATLPAESLLIARAADYFELIKPRIQVLVLFTVVTGALLGAGGAPAWTLLLNCVIGTALVASGASALNQYLERGSDALMNRTADRPLPAGRLQPFEVLVFGLSLSVIGFLYLLVSLPQPTAALIAGFTGLSYVLVYTPLKRRTTLNTLIGAVPGALPPVIGWAAVRGTVGSDVLPLFLIVFIWQVPHFLAIAWMYREDYARAGLCMLTVLDRDGGMTSRQMITYCLALIPVSLLPALLGMAGPVYAVGAIVLGLSFLASTLRFRKNPSIPQARRVLKTSLVYLPGLLLLLLADGLISQLSWFPARF